MGLSHAPDSRRHITFIKHIACKDDVGFNMLTKAVARKTGNGDTIQHCVELNGLLRKGINFTGRGRSSTSLHRGNGDETRA